MPKDFSKPIQQLEKEGNKLLDRYGHNIVPLYYGLNDDDIPLFDTDSIRDEFRDVLEFLEEHNCKVMDLQEEIEND